MRISNSKPAQTRRPSNFALHFEPSLSSVMKLKEIYRTSTFAWSPAANLPTLATGTVAGALDESFSNASQLEIWAPNFLDKDEYDLGHQDLHGPKGFVEDTSR